jgi:hypothetical protein
MNAIRLINEVGESKKPKWYKTLTFMITPTIVRTTDAHPKRNLKVKLIEINSKPLFPKENDENPFERDACGRKLLSIRQKCFCPKTSEGHNGGGQTSMRDLARILNPYLQEKSPYQSSDSEEDELPDPYTSSDELPDLE